jgi:predicted permease
MGTILLDLKHALRALLRAPGFATAAVLTLALGIGATSALFSVADVLILRPLPFKEASRIVIPVTTNLARNIESGSVSYPDYLDWKEARNVFESVAVFWNISVDLAGGDQPERLVAMNVSDEFFAAVGLEAGVGRLFAPDEYLHNAPRTAVLSDGLYRRRFGGDPSILGRTVEINGERYTVVGVARPEKTWPGNVEIFIPLRFAPAPPDWVMRRDNCIFRAVARLAPGVRHEGAMAFQRLMGARVAAENPESKAGTSYAIVSLRDWVVPAKVRRATLVLFWTVVLVLLIACVNVANLTLARGAAREREIAVRAALGAGRGWLFSHVISE